VAEVARDLGVNLVRDVARHHALGQRQRGALARVEMLRLAPQLELVDLVLGHARLARHLQVLRPLVVRARDLRRAQDHDLAQLARRAAVVADRIGELGPGRGQRRVVAEGAVQVDRLAPQLLEPLFQAGLELGHRNALHGRA